MFTRILIANRGEIAVRIIRACREMGIVSATVFSEIDRKALHVRLADEAYPIGASPASESYLDMRKIVAAAGRCGAQAVHPGYGFLAENPEFAGLVESEGFVFIGPPPGAIRLLGDKIEARKTMRAAGIPIVPGSEAQIESEEQAAAVSETLGYPVLIKAAAGGGGKGIRIVRKKEEIRAALDIASSEARSAFADSRVYIEKYLDRPRHVEVQILADRYGAVVNLGERECSIQRRYQKMIEESPSPVVDEPMRRRLGETAVAAARAADYVNAGTMEFLVDKDRDFYFLESNTRLQVEHPVSELVTGIDIVKEQIKIAAGERLSFGQGDVRRQGAALECRINAEDPDNDFLPSCGTVGSYLEPAGPGVRVDSGLYEGCEIPLLYDPIVAKLITWGTDRGEAIRRMVRSLAEYRIAGVATSVPFHRKVMANPRFLSGDLSTHFIEEEFGREAQDARRTGDESTQVAAIVSAWVDYRERKKPPAACRETRAEESKWKTEGRQRGLRQLS